MFLADLSRLIHRAGKHTDLFVYVMRARSYDSERVTSGIVKIDLDIQQSIADKHAIIVEDVVDTKLTLTAILEHVKSKKPLSVKVFTLIDKIPDQQNLCQALEKIDQTTLEKRRKLNLDWIGFPEVKGFLVGAGMDDGGDKRAQPYLTVKTC